MTRRYRVGILDLRTLAVQERTVEADGDEEAVLCALGAARWHNPDAANLHPYRCTAEERADLSPEARRA